MSQLEIEDWKLEIVKWKKRQIRWLSVFWIMVWQY